MGSPAVTNLMNVFRYMPQHAIEGALGDKWGPRVEGWLGMSPSPDGPTLGAAPVAHPDPSWHNQMVENATQSFATHPAATAPPNLTTMRKPLRAK